MQNLKKFETKKLFYNKFLYKISTYNKLAFFFRNKNFPNVRKILDELSPKYKKKDPIVLRRWLRNEIIAHEQFVDAQILFQELKDHDDIQVRVEGPILTVYSNDKKLIDSLCKKLNNVYELHEPSSLNLKELTEGYILMKSPIYKKFKYRVTMGPKANPEFTKWLENNQDKVKYGKTFFSTMQTNGYTNGLYFYVKDDKCLMLVNLMLGNLIRRTDRIYSSRV